MFQLLEMSGYMIFEIKGWKIYFKNNCNNNFHYNILTLFTKYQKKKKHIKMKSYLLKERDILLTNCLSFKKQQKRRRRRRNSNENSLCATAASGALGCVVACRETWPDSASATGANEYWRRRWPTRATRPPRSD